MGPTQLLSFFASKRSSFTEACTAHEMIPTPKWYRLRTDPHFSSRLPRNDPQLILGMELVFRHGIITNLLQRLRS